MSSYVACSTFEFAFSTLVGYISCHVHCTYVYQCLWKLHSFHFMRSPSKTQNSQIYSISTMHTCLPIIFLGAERIWIFRNRSSLPQDRHFFSTFYCFLRLIYPPYKHAAHLKITKLRHFPQNRTIVHWRNEIQKFGKYLRFVWTICVCASTECYGPVALFRLVNYTPKKIINSFFRWKSKKYCLRLLVLSALFGHRMHFFRIYEPQTFQNSEIKCENSFIYLLANFISLLLRRVSEIAILHATNLCHRPFSSHCKKIIRYCLQCLQPYS